VSIYCVLLTPQWKRSLRSASKNVGETWYLKMQHSTTRQAKQKISLKIINKAKSGHFFVCKWIGFVHQELRAFVKMPLTRVWSHWLWLEPSPSVKNVTRVESSHHFSQRESSRVRVTKKSSTVTRVDSMSRVKLSLLPAVVTSLLTWIFEYCISMA